MASRFRWFLLGNLIGIIMLIIGVLVFNPYAKKQEAKPNGQALDASQKTEPPTSATSDSKASEKKPGE
jgi:hypothetical protein